MSSKTTAEDCRRHHHRRVILLRIRAAGSAGKLKISPVMVNLQLIEIAAVIPKSEK